MESVFYYPVILHRGASAAEVIAASANNLPIGHQNVDQLMILTSSEGNLDQGLYVWDGSRWRLAMPYLEVCRALIEGDVIDVYYALDTDVTGIPPIAHIFRNALPYSGNTLVSGLDVIWAVRQLANPDVGDVKSVNGVLPDGAGNVVIPPASASVAGLVKVGSGLSVTGDGTLSVSGSSYVLPVATATVLGGVKQGTNVTIAGDGTISVAAPYTLPNASASVLGGVKVGAGLAVAGDGTLSVTAVGGVSSVSGQTGAVVIKAQDNNAATGTSLIVGDGSGTGIIKLKTVVAGSNITLAADGNGNLVIGSTASGNLTAVQGTGTGTSLIFNDGTTGGIAQLKSLAAGSNITITPAGDNKTLTITANQVLNPATTTTIGGVIVKAGLSVDGSGNLTLAAPTGVNLGGVKAGTGISIAADGTISSSGAVASVSGQTGIVVVQASDTSTASGTSLISDSGATTGNIKIKRLVAGSNVTLAADGNGNLQISSTLAATVTSFATGTSGQLHGDIVFAAGQAISLSNTGNTIQINGTGVPEAPNDGNLYGRQNMGWTIIPATSNPITAVNGQAGTGAVLLVEASPPANTAVIKSLVAGANITLNEVNGLITVTAAIPGGTVATVNSKAPDGSGNVTLAAADVSALPTAGGTMSGDINMATHKVTGLPTPTNPSDAVPYSLITGMVIDGGVIG